MTAKQKTRFQAAILMLQETMAGIGELMRAILDDDDEPASDAVLLNVSDTAKLLSKSKRWVQQQAKQGGELEGCAVRVGGEWRFKRTGVVSYIEGRTKLKG